MADQRPWRTFVALMFWSMFGLRVCAPCIREMPALAKVSRKYPSLKVIAISVDRGDKAELARKKLKELSGGTLAFYNDPLMRIAFPLKAKGLPVSVIFDKQGKEIARIDGAVEWDDSKAQELIVAIIKPL